MPRVSIIIPTLDRALLLKKAIESISRQTYQDYEILVIQNGGLETARPIVQFFQKRDLPIFYYQEAKADPVHARNVGIELTRGELIAFLDDDDQWLEEKLQKQIAVLDSSPEVGMVACRGWDCDKQGQKRTVRPPSPLICDQKALIQEDVVNVIRTLSAVVVRKECFDRVGLFNSKYKISNDLDFYLRLSNEYSIHCLEDILYLYTWHGKNLSADVTNGWMDVIQILKNFDPNSSRGATPEMIQGSLTRYRSYLKNDLEHQWSQYRVDRMARKLGAILMRELV